LPYALFVQQYGKLPSGVMGKTVLHAEKNVQQTPILHESGVGFWVTPLTLNPEPLNP
jgi:hypothetical protein